ncbi:MAG: haloalkane dehalogenase [Myxococcota bacterium]|nr:haloalkane dehalogenase [Myxococcota bacterium]
MEFVRTPEGRFENLPDYPFAPHYAEVRFSSFPALRMHYVDEGPPDGPTVLMLHGEPTWSYLYRKMIPLFVEAGFRVVAPDHIGFGRSDKPTDKTVYSFEAHRDAMHEFILSLSLESITLIVQDWGGPIGLGVLAREPDRFAHVVTANTMLHTAEAELAGRVSWSNHASGTEDVCVAEGLLAWILHSQRATEFEASPSIAGTTVRPMSDEVLAAYDAPFPDESHKAGMRQFPALIPITPNDPGALINRNTWQALEDFRRPFLTLFADSDPSTAGWEKIFQQRVPGAAGQPHGVIEEAGHFIQEDAGPELASAILGWLKTN